jgi:proteasome accessory factor B
MLALTATGLQVSEIADRLGVSERTAQRYVRALEEKGLVIQEEQDGHKKLLRIVQDRLPTISFGRRELLTLESARHIMRSFHGTGMDSDMDRVLEKIRAHTSERELQVLDRFASKIRYLDEAAYEYGDREDAYSEIVTAVIREQRLKLRHVAVDRGHATFRFDPYSLLIYRKGVYVVGFSHHHQSVRTLGLDGVVRVRWLRKESFEIPADFDVDRIIGGAFGLIAGATTEVRLRFAAGVARYVRRRRWHPSQRLSEVEGGLEMELRVDGTKELSSWILGFGSKVEVLQPATLRSEIAREHQRAMELNRDG